MPGHRAQWKGFIKFGEVNCGVGLYTAARTSDRIAFLTLNKATGNRVSCIFVDSETGKPVEREDQTIQFFRSLPMLPGKPVTAMSSGVRKPSSSGP